MRFPVNDASPSVHSAGEDILAKAHSHQRIHQMLLFRAVLKGTTATRNGRFERF